jgi:hypothetical protein
VSVNHRFRAVIEAARGGGSVALIPDEIVDALGGVKAMRVTGTLNGNPYTSNIFPYQRKAYLGVHKATREAAGVAVGEEADFEISRDDRPRTVALAPELEAALAGEPELRARFEALSVSRRRELADPVAEARRPETRAARVDKALTRLRELI